MTAESAELRVLDVATRDAVVAAVEAAKARGWTQAHLREWFSEHGVELEEYLAARRGQGLTEDVVQALAMVSIVGLPHLPPGAYAAVPEAMKNARRWLLWRLEPNESPGGKPRKTPYYADGRRRQGRLDTPDDIGNLVTFDQACALLPQYTGLGFALGADGEGRWQGIDLDDIDNHPGLQFVAGDLPGYVEQSPSGRGLHAIGYGEEFRSLGSNSTGIEAYAGGRYFTVTGEGASGDLTCLASFVRDRLAPLHSTRPQDTGKAADPGSIEGAMAARDLRSALTALRADDYHLWIRIGMALKGLGEVGRGLWLEWSQTSVEYDAVVASQKWETFRPTEISYKTVFAEAQAAGWANPASGAGPANEEARAETAAEEERQAGTIQATRYTWVEPSKIPPRDVLYGRHLFRQFLSATVAPGGLGKSSLVIVEALAMVCGVSLLGERPKGPLSVWYWNGEDPKEELQRRIAAAALHYELSDADVGGRLFVDSGRDTEIVIAREDRNGAQVAVPVVEALIQTVRANSIDVLIIDPFVASHSVAENDNTKIEAVVRQWMRVAEEGRCAVELVHHVRKPGGAAQETTVDDARGAGALLAKARSARVLNAMAVDEADELGIDRKDRFRFFRVDNGKANLMPRGGDARWRRMIGVPLGNRVDAQEDEVGVVTEWQRPGALDGVTAADLMRVKIAIAAGQWREDIRAANWAGHAIGGALGIDTVDAQGRGRVKSMLKIWLKSGALEVVQGFDESRRPRQFVVIGKGEE